MSEDPGAPIVTVSVQFPTLGAAEFAQLRGELLAARAGRIVVPHEAHRWYAASSDPDTVRTLVSALDAVLAGRTLSFDDEEALDDLSEEYADWLAESAETDDAEPGPVLSFSVYLPSLGHDEFAGLGTRLRAEHPRRVVLGEQRGHSHHELSERSRIESRLPGLRAAGRGDPVRGVEALALRAQLDEYARWLSEWTDRQPINGGPGG